MQQAQRVFKLRDVHECGFVQIAELPSLVAESLAGLTADDDDATSSPPAPTGGGGAAAGTAPAAAAVAAPAFALKFVRSRVDKDNSGIVLWKDFFDALCALGSAGDPTATFKRHFDALDAHGAGFLPNGQLQALLSRVANEVPLEHYDLAALTRTLDPDRFGVIMWSKLEDQVGLLARVPTGSSSSSSSSAGSNSFEIREFELFYYNGLQRRIHGVLHGPQFRAFGMNLLPGNDIRSIEQMAGTA